MPPPTVCPSIENSCHGLGILYFEHLFDGGMPIQFALPRLCSTQFCFFAKPLNITPTPIKTDCTPFTTLKVSQGVII